MKILTIVGARPQFIKAASISRVFEKCKDIEEVIVHTGQHYDFNMSDIFFDEMFIPKANYFLDINGLSHGAMTGQMLEKIEDILILEKPDYVLVYGDTNSTLAGALAAKKLHLRLVHVEAGLRSNNNNMPEEINRILTDRISDILFCPTDNSMSNLITEGYNNFRVKSFVVGDVMQDSAYFYKQLSDKASGILRKLNVTEGNFILGTVHREENTRDIGALREIIESFNVLSERVEVIVPIHPRTQKIIKDNKFRTDFRMIQPVGYFDMLQLIANSKLIVTDSGGLQKEAYFFNKYCVTLREETEWIELIENGYNRLVGANQKKIVAAVEDLSVRIFNKGIPLYGDGNASQRICNLLLEDFQISCNEK